MALSISYAQSGQQKTLAWYVGNDATALNLLAGATESLQADGNELRHILTSFGNIPHCKTGRLVQTWYGDHARFIAANL